MFNYVDIILIVVIVSFMITGYMNGFLRALGNIVSFVLAMMAGSFVTVFLIKHFYLNPLLPGNIVILIIAFFIVAVVIGFVVGFLVGTLESVRKIIPFTKTVNSLLGMVLGFAEGIIFAATAFIFTSAYGHGGKVSDAVLGSQLADWFSGITQILSHLFPTVTVIT